VLEVVVGYYINDDEEMDVDEEALDLCSLLMNNIHSRLNKLFRTNQTLGMDAMICETALKKKVEIFYRTIDVYEKKKHLESVTKYKESCQLANILGTFPGIEKKRWKQVMKKKENKTVENQVRNAKDNKFISR